MNELLGVVLSFILLVVLLIFAIKYEKKQQDYYFDRLDKIIKKNK